jgi:SAM-dependent methyltransferase
MTTSGRSASATLPEIEQFWQTSARAEHDAEGLRPTARDPSLQDLVETACERWIEPHMRLFDIGCGDGHSTVRFARRAASAVGFDYITNFVEMARANGRRAECRNLTFDQANVLDLASVRERHGLADVVVTIRCLINLPEWNLQRQAVEEIAKTVKPGGLYLLSEGWLEGFDGLNTLRARAGLEPLNLVKYNSLMSRHAFEDFVTPLFEIAHYENLGFYLAMSRVLQPQVVKPEPPQHTHRINSAAAELLKNGVGRGEFLDADYAGVMVLRRRMVENA